MAISPLSPTMPRSVIPQPLVRAAGDYVLILTARTPSAVRVGALGELELRRGVYAYVGSARGPGGLAARIAHHLKPAAHRHWHLDYVVPLLQPREVWWLAGRENREHLWAARLAQLDAASVPLRRFGASDCRCLSHLFYFRRAPRPAVLAEVLVRVTPVSVLHAR
ncbi:MAG: GIY-YIG nuclease family protein [Bryobacteraceae bacterium]|nr:GIY-YIG nuclease family protein [Bryobacteraceae bacterium]